MVETPRSTALLRRVSRRLRLALVGRRFFLALLVCGGAYAAALLASRLLGLYRFPQPLIVLATVPAAALLTALLWHRRPTTLDAARRVDRHRGTKDLYLTFALLERSAGEYQALVVRDAEERAGSIQPASVVPFWWANRAAWSMGVLAALVLGAFLLPQLDPFGTVAAAEEDERRYEEFLASREETARRIEQLTAQRDESEGENSEAVQKAIEGLKTSLNRMKPKERQANEKMLADHQSDLGGKWQKLNAEQMKELMNRTARSQEFGGASDEKLEKWTRELQEGSTETLRKELDELKNDVQRLMAEKDPVKREELAQQLKKRLKDMEDFASERAGSKPLAAALQRAMKQLESARKSGISDEVADALEQSLDLSKLELEELAQTAKDLKALEEALKVVQMAKKVNDEDALDGEACQNCVSLDDYAELYAEMMQGMEPGEGAFEGEGFGEGGEAPEDESVTTDFKTERSQSPITAGKVLLSLKTKGLSDRGDAVQAYRESVEQVRQGVSAAIEQEQIPPGYHEGIKSYFDTIEAPEPPGE